MVVDPVAPAVKDREAVLAVLWEALDDKLVVYPVVIWREPFRNEQAIRLRQYDHCRHVIRSLIVNLVRVHIRIAARVGDIEYPRDQGRLGGGAVLRRSVSAVTDHRYGIRHYIDNKSYLSFCARQ